MGKRETDSTIFLGTHDKVIVNPDNDTKNQSKWQHNAQEGTLGENNSKRPVDAPAENGKWLTQLLTTSNQEMLAHLKWY